MPQKTLEQILSKNELDQIITWYTEENVSLREIENRTGKSRAALSRMLERLNIKTTTGNHYRKYFFNFDFFETIDNELKAYWLGFLYADGCIESKDTLRYGEQSFKLALAERDIDVLEKLKYDLNSTYPIRYDNSLRSANAMKQVIYAPRCQKTVDDLIKLGCVERKSLILTFPTKNQVPENLIRHFIRGYFDGDGSISEYKGSYYICFVGTESFIKSLYNQINMGSVYPDKRKINSWYLNISGNLKVIKLYHYLYDNSSRYMDRKFNKFQPLLEKYGESQGIKE